MDTSMKVARGAALLDAMLTGDWRARVNADRLNMASLTDCVVGQLFAGQNDEASESAWSYGIDRLGLTPAEATLHGFDSMSTAEFAELDRLWRAEVRRDVKV